MAIPILYTIPEGIWIAYTTADNNEILMEKAIELKNLGYTVVGVCNFLGSVFTTEKVLEDADTPWIEGGIWSNTLRGLGIPADHAIEN